MVEAAEHRIQIETPDHPLDIHLDPVEGDLLTTLYATWQEYNLLENNDIADFADAAGWTIRALQGKQRESGTLPASSHPFEVAKILAQAHLDRETIIAGLLHDDPEDTKDYPPKSSRKITHEMIENRFGVSVSRMVENMTKLKGAKNQDLTPRNHLKMFEALLEDYRTIFVKLADRLHNMRTIWGLKDVTKRRRKAEETIKIYAPLAMHLGMKEWAEELMDLSFQTLYKRDYPKIRELYQSTLTLDAVNEVTTRIHGYTTMSDEIVKTSRHQSRLLDVIVQTPSLFSLYKENDDSFPDIPKESIAPLVTLVVKKRRIKKLPEDFTQTYHFPVDGNSDSLLRSVEQEEWISDVAKYLTKIGTGAQYRRNPWSRLQLITEEKTPYFYGTFLHNTIPFRVRFITKRADEEEQSSLFDLINRTPKTKYALRKLRKLQTNIQRARRFLQKGKGERVTQTVQQITQNLDTDLIYVKTPQGNVEVVQKGTVRDVIWQLHEGIAESAFSYTVQRGKEKPITGTDFTLPIEEDDQVTIHTDGRNNLVQVSWLDEAETRYARKKIAERLRKKIQHEAQLPDNERIITREVIKRGERELRQHFFRYANRMNAPMDELRIGIDKVKQKWEHHHTRKNPMSGNSTTTTPEDFLIHLGLEEISMYGPGRRIIKDTVAELFRMQRSLVPVEIDLTDEPGSFAHVSDHLSRELGINILGIFGVARQSEENAQHVVFYMTKRDARKLTRSELAKLHALSCVWSVERGLSMDEQGRTTN